MDESTTQPPGPEPSSRDGSGAQPSGKQSAETFPIEPELDPVIDERVRELLASAAPPPMPADLEHRILRALAEEAARQESGAATVPMVPAAPTHPGQADHDVLTPLIRQRQRPRRLFAAAAVAAAAALVAVGGSALHLNKRPGAPAVAVAGSAPTSTPTVGAPLSTASPSGSSAAPTVHIQLSRTAYAPDTLVAQARALLADPAAPLREGAAEAPSLGPIATEIGLASCLEALGAPVPDSVSADLATYAGEPAAVIVVTSRGASTAVVVRRSCTIGDPQVLHGATPLR